MKITLSDKIIAWLALFSGLTISAVAIWYSVAGLVSIFAAAMIPIIVMGVVLEVSKLIATVWLKINWNRAPVFIRTYLLIAIAVLMLITSMGIFGFLSKAHSDAGLVSGDVQAKIAVYDEKIKTERENIDAARKALTQMDAQVNERLSRSTDDKGAERAVQIRRQQQAERTRLQNDISRSQGVITKLNEERAPIAAEVRKVEAEVGPIKYIANFIYGDNPDANILEKAVTWVIIIIVAVFDPLAVILLLASQYSFQWFRKAREEEEADSPKQPEPVVDVQPPEPEVTEQVEDREVSVFEKHPYLLNSDFWKKPEGWVDVPPQVYKPEQPPVEEEQPPVEVEADVEEDSELNHPDDTAEMKAAKTQWKHDHPTDSLKRHRKLYDQGLISKLPWESYLTPAPTEDEVEEQVDSKKKSNELDRESGQPAGEEKQGTLKSYVQNAEQNESTIWQRVKKAKEE
jgi:hypothetical protein